jgi:hypothetical protein
MNGYTNKLQEVIMEGHIKTKFRRCTLINLNNILTNQIILLMRNIGYEKERQRKKKSANMTILKSLLEAALKSKVNI